jgi:glutathione S-transferase
MKLYYSPGACSLSPHIVALEAGLALTLERVDLRTHKTEAGADYYAINPKGYVPALLLEDGNLLTEGSAIVQYLADLAPGTSLLAPVGSFARYKTVEWLTYINGEIHKSFGPLFHGSDEEKKAAVEKIGKRFAYTETALGAQDYLTGDTFTVADAYLFVMLRWAHAKKVGVPNGLERFHTRIAARPAVQAALAEEGLST